MNLLQGLREDYEVNPFSLDALTRFFKQEAEYEADVLEKVWESAAFCLQRSGFEGRAYPLFQQIRMSPRKEEEKERLFLLFAGTVWFREELEGVTGCLVESKKATEDLKRETLVVEVAFAHFNRLQYDLQRKLVLIRTVTPSLLQLEGEAGRVAKGLYPFISKGALIPNKPERPLSNLISIRAEEEVKAAQVAKLVGLAENLFDAYRGAIFPALDSAAVEGFVGSLKSYLPYLVNLAFVKAPRPLSNREKQAVLSVLNAGSKLLGDLDTLKKEQKPPSAKALVQLGIQKWDIARSQIKERLSKIVRLHKGGGDPHFPSEPSKGEQFASDLMIGFLLYTIEQIFQPRVVLRLIERLLDEAMDLDTFEKSFPPLSAYAADDDVFSKNSGERLEWLIRKAVSLLMGTTATTNLAIKFFNQKAVGMALQRFINKTLQSEVDMMPLMIIGHLLLEKDKPALLDPVRSHANLALEIKNKLRGSIKGGSAIAGWFLGGKQTKMDKALNYLSEVIVAFAESQEALYVIAIYILDGYLDFLNNTASFGKK